MVFYYLLKFSPRSEWKKYVIKLVKNPEGILTHFRPLDGKSDAATSGFLLQLESNMAAVLLL